jgi:integrase
MLRLVGTERWHTYAGESGGESPVLVELRGIHAILERMESLSVPVRGGQEPLRAVGGASPIADLPEQYVRDHAENLHERYLAQLRSLLRDLAAHAAIDDWRVLTREHIEAFLRHCADDGRERRDKAGRKLGGPTKAGPKTRTTYLYMISGFLSWCIDGERGGFSRSNENAAGRVTKPKRVRRKQRAFTAAECAALLDGAEWCNMVQYRTLAISGLRHGAATEIPAAWFLLDDEPPRVEIPEEHSKTGAAYVAVLDPITAKMLRVLRTSIDDYSPNLPLLKRIRNDKLQADCVRAGVVLVDERGRRVGFNCFRRFVPTALDRMGINATVAQAQLGHANIATTLTHYTDSGLPDQAKAASALAREVCAVDKQAQQISLSKPVDRGTDSRYFVSATSPMQITTTTTTERAAGTTGDVAETGLGRPFTRGSVTSPAPSGTRRDTSMGAAGLEPVARQDIPPRMYDLVSRMLSIVERAAPVRAGEEPADANRKAV